jgi:uncharacterized membrane protein (DUF441 family)
VTTDRKTAVLYGLLFAIPPAIAATTAVDVLAGRSFTYSLAAGVVTAAVIFGFVLLTALTGERDAERKQDA